MKHGQAFGLSEKTSVLSFFRDDRSGYTSVAVALALLLSVSLIFSVASVQWLMSKSADVQAVADASACAGAHVVAAYTDIVHCLDACVLSMGLTGLTLSAAGFIMLCIPGVEAQGEELLSRAFTVLEQRQNFAQSAYGGLEKLEAALPALIAANGASIVQANSDELISYVGVAVPFPIESKSSFPQGKNPSSVEALSNASEELVEASKVAQAAREHAADAQKRGWEADCGARPYCLRLRAETLAGLPPSLNPDYPSPQSWTFGAAIQRARAYYERRIAIEAPYDAGIESLTDSLARRAFYEYALSQVQAASYKEHEDGSVALYLPPLPKNTSEVRSTSLYTDVRWPLSQEETGVLLHSTMACPGATGPFVGEGSLAAQEAGELGHCEVCRMDVGDMGKTPAASTNIDNGFEHWWRELVRAGKDFERYKNELAEAEKAMESAAQKGKNAFEEALEALCVEHPRLCPPGAWGILALVARPNTSAGPPSLSSAFLDSGDLPPGAAISASVIAPDSATQDNNVLSGFLNHLLPEEGNFLISSADKVLTLWGEILLGYEGMYEKTSSVLGSFLDGIDGVFSSRLGGWLKHQLGEVIAKAGLEPIDMRCMKPVLTASSNVLAKAGIDKDSQLRQLILSLPSGAGVETYAQAMARYAFANTGAITLAELPIPGSEARIPITIDISRLAGAL